MGAAAGDTGFDYYIAAAWAGLAFSPKDAGEVHITAPLALGIDVVTVSGATFFYGQI